MIDPVLRDAESKMSKSVDHFAAELTGIRTGRANPALIDKVMVPYYGTPTPLNQLAQISAPEPRLLVVQVYDKSQIGAIEKALRMGEQGLNPASDGQVIRVPIPPLTEERRKEYDKLARNTAEGGRARARSKTPPRPPAEGHRGPDRTCRRPGGPQRSRSHGALGPYTSPPRGEVPAKPGVGRSNCPLGTLC